MGSYGAYSLTVIWLAESCNYCRTDNTNQFSILLLILYCCKRTIASGICNHYQFRLSSLPVVIAILRELEVKEEINPDAHKSESELPDEAGKAKQKAARELALPRRTRGGGGKLLVYDTVVVVSQCTVIQPQQ